MPKKPVDYDRETAARIIALFSVVVHGWATNDFAAAASAKAELESLGVTVKLPRRTLKRQAAGPQGGDR